MLLLHKGRKLHLTNLLPRVGRRLSAAYQVALLQLPAFLPACSTLPEPVPQAPPPVRKVQIYIFPTGKTTLQTLDLLFFQEGPLERLDAYQHYGPVSNGRIEGTSSGAARKAVAFSNCAGDIYSWSDIRSYNSLTGRKFRLEDEHPESPMMVGTAILPEGSHRSCGIELRPMLSRITVHSIACDFTGHPYVGEKLTDVRAYLTYASRECHPLDTADRPSSWINAGRLDEVETAGLSHPELVLADVGSSLGGRIYPALDFYCYPNPADGTVFGQPVTRLVIEGKLRGVTYYYPIGLPGLEADTQYYLDITLTRTGTTDPDIPAVSGTILLQNEVLDWDERELDDVFYR